MKTKNNFYRITIKILKLACIKLNEYKKIAK